MNPHFLLPEFNWTVLLPFVVIAMTGIFGLVALLFQTKASAQTIQRLTLVGVFVAIVSQFGLFGNQYTGLGEMVVKTNPGMIGEALVLISLFVVVLISKPYLARTKIECPEFYPMICWSALGGMIMCSSENLLVIFVGLELLSISLYVLAGLNRRSKFSQESAIKYFLLGAFSTGFFLYGIAFLYGASGTLHLDGFLTMSMHLDGDNRMLAIFGFGLILVGLCFKCGIVPFHQWIPDVYSGAPTNVVAFMATGAKIGPFIALYNLVLALPIMNSVAIPICIALSILSMVVGNIMAFSQHDVKKILAYSSIVNAGYILIYLSGIMKGNSLSEFPFGYFLLGYVFATLGIFVILSLIAGDDKEPITLHSLRGLSKRNPGLAALLVIFVLSQVGIGPVAGFVGKLVFVTHLVVMHQAWLAIILLANSAFAAFYYLKIIKAAYSDSDETSVTRFEPGFEIKTALAVCFIGVVGSVIFYAPIFNFVSPK